MATLTEYPPDVLYTFLLCCWLTHLLLLLLHTASWWGSQMTSPSCWKLDWTVRLCLYCRVWAETWSRLQRCNQTKTGHTDRHNKTSCLDSGVSHRVLISETCSFLDNVIVAHITSELISSYNRKETLCIDPVQIMSLCNNYVSRNNCPLSYNVYKFTKIFRDSLYVSFLFIRQQYFHVLLFQLQSSLLSTVDQQPDPEESLQFNG